jgi:hypothetical protein
MKRQFKSCGNASKKHLGRLKKLNEKDTKTEKRIRIKQRSKNRKKNKQKYTQNHKYGFEIETQTVPKRKILLIQLKQRS